MKFSQREIDLLKKFYPQYQRKIITMFDLQKLFNRSVDSLTNAARRYGCIEKVAPQDNIDEEYLKKLSEVTMI